MAIVALSGGEGFAQANRGPAPVPPNPYRTILDWPKMPSGKQIGSTAGVDIDADGRSVWLFDRCGANSCAGSSLAPILKFDSTGRLVRSFGEGLFVGPHGIHVDRDGNVWVTDGQGPDGKDPSRNGRGHQVFKFSADGKLLMRLGTAGVAGEGPNTFNAPSDVVVARNGDIFVADGHGGNTNARIVKFSKDGTFIKAWGKSGSGPGEFNIPHGVAFDSRERLFVADRANNRIQIFDQDGKYLDEWKQFGRPSGIYITSDDTIYVADADSDEKRNPGRRKGISIGSARTGTVTAFIPVNDQATDAAGPTPNAAEGIAVDNQGGVYGAGHDTRTLEKHVRR
jgi:sugar lactone lactonase YvrE